MCCVTWKHLECVSEARWWWAWTRGFSIFDLDWSPCFFPWAEIEESSTSWVMWPYTNFAPWSSWAIKIDFDFRQNKLKVMSLKSLIQFALSYGAHSSSSENTQTLKDGLAPWIYEESALGSQPKWAHHHHHHHHLISRLIFTTPPCLPQLDCIEWSCCSVAWPLLLGGAVEGGGR